ncbi:hypothetical protein COLO4_30403 [Corchorus olitorius]|uniref:non-specific serine/threonine protein kinase n=1 Tax=Corchorus olitorius TaxID=93759 RepID=A0A1R3H8R1_9ROSI|nr:hypothetical protein COLO4_30403 [Corchorus olitorius]
MSTPTSPSPTSPPSSPNNTSPPPSVSPPPPPLTNDSFPVSPPPPAASPPNGTTGLPPPSEGGLPPGTMAGLITGVVLGAVIVLIGVGIFVVFYKRRKRKLAQNNSGGPPPQGPKVDPQHWQQNAPQVAGLPRPSPPQGISPHHHIAVNVNASAVPPSTSTGLGSEKLSNPSPSQGTFSYEDLALATDNFSDLNLIGQGGFGYVHKGVLKDGKVVAIKQLKAGSRQGEREFQAEVDIISRVHHRHLVSLVGYCIIEEKRLLVYEFVPNNTLEFHLHGKERPVMNWSTRMKIAMGAAKGLAYLHGDCQPKIIHRDIKASNILLDDSFEARVADFGLAKYSLDTDTHVSTRVMGTFGYMAPEYAASGKLTEKSDVFSFGVVLLELITGRRPVDKAQPFFDDSIVDWVSITPYNARPLLAQALEHGNFDAFVDPRLQKDYDSSEMTRLVACAAACVRHSARHRPRMSQVVRALEGNISLDDLNEGITPGHSTQFGSYGSSDYSSFQYNEDMKKFRKMALESQELGSSEYSGLTSEYGVNPSGSSTEGQIPTTQEMDASKVDKETKDVSQST